MSDQATGRPTPLVELSGEPAEGSERAPAMAELLDEIQRLTRYQGRVELGTMYVTGHTPANGGRPMATYRVDENDEIVDLPYYAGLPEWGLEGIGRTWEAALGHIVAGLRAQEGDR